MMEKARIAVFVSGGGTNLQALIDADLPHGRLALVVADNPKAYALTRAGNAGIKTAVVSRKKAGSQQAFEAGILKELQEERIELIVLAGFLSILSKDFTDRYPNRILNVHPSLIPSFCGKGFYGLKVHEAALARGAKVTGATVHMVNEVTDGGRIILQKAVDVLPDDTPERLQKRVMEQAEWVLLPQAAEMISCEITEGREDERV